MQCNQGDNLPLRGDLSDQIEDLKLSTKVEVAGGLVHEQHLWPLHQGLGYRDHLILSTAQLVYGPGSNVFESQIRQNIKGQRQILLRDSPRECAVSSQKNLRRSIRST